MKKIMLLCLAILSLLHSKEDFYSEEVLSLSLDKGTKAVGRLLPTNPFQILKQEGDWVKILISGYSNPQAPFAIYFNDSQRIMVAAFSKDTPLHFTQRVAGEGGKWDLVSLEVWTEKRDFAKDNQAMFVKAKNLFEQNCGICHALHKEQEFGVNQWQSTFRSMASRTGIDKKDHWLVIEYLQKNAKDFKGGIK